MKKILSFESLSIDFGSGTGTDMKGTRAGPEKLAPFHTNSRLWINYYVELLIDFNGNKFAVRKTVIDGANKTGRSGNSMKGY